MKKFVLVVFTAVIAQIGYAGNCHTAACFDRYVKDNSLNLSHKIDTDDIPALISYLQIHPDIKNLDISDSHLGETAGVLLAHNNTLVELDAHYNDMKTEAAKAFSRNNTLRVLDLADNDINDEGAIALATNYTLVSLNISNQDFLCTHSTGLTDEVAKAFAKNTTLKNLDLSFNAIHSEGSIALAHSQTLESLDLMGNYLDDQGIAAFSNNKTIRKLDLISQNEKAISGYGFIQLAKNRHIEELAINGKFDYEALHFLSKNPSLRSLTLIASELDQKGFIELIKNSELTKLELYTRQKLTDDVAFALVENQKIKNLVLQSAIDNSFASILAKTSTIASLDISNNFCANPQCTENAGLISDIGAVALAANHSITMLDLYGNQVGDQGAIALASNTTLRELNIGKNKVGSLGLNALHQSTTLEKLYDNQFLVKYSVSQRKKLQRYLDIMK